MKKWLGLVFILTTFSAIAQNKIIPAPLSVKPAPGYFTFDPTTYLLGNDQVAYKDGYVIKNFLIKYYNLPLKTATKTIGVGKHIALKYDSTLAVSDGGYHIIISPENITITGKNNGGVLYGLLSLMQLIEKTGNTYQIPCGEITDYPQFQYRGMHLDCARHFFDMAFIKKYIDYLAMYKMNTFHWHLTDDQGWRIEIKQYPKLTEIGAWRDGTMVGHYRDQQYDNVRYGGFYTQKEIKEIVRYATDRHITIIPEIEMPGHCMAALAAYPELGCVSDTTYQVAKGWGVFEDVFCPNDSTFIFLENVLDEVMALFPSPYIHIGGDEVEKIRWRNCSHCQQLIKEKGLINEHGLQSYFIQRIEKYVNSKGRSIIGWDEILEGGLAQNATIMSWRGEEGAVLAAQQKHYAIMTPGSHCYFDYYQGAPQLEPLAIGGFVPLDKVYGFNPIPASLTQEQATYILGAQANIWTEYISFPEQVEYMLLPRMLALSEVLWTSNENKSYDDFLKRLLFHFQLLDKTNTNYAKSIYQINYKVTPANELNKLNITLLSNPLLGKIEVQTVNVLNGAKNNFTYENPFTVSAETPYVSAQLNGSIKNTPTTQIKLKFNKATGKSITLKNEPSKKYSGDGAFTLLNGVEATVNPSWNGNEWLGFLTTDFQAIIDLGEVDSINRVSIGCLFDKLSWIYPAESVQIWVSTNGKNYEQAGKIKYKGDQKRNAITITSTVKTGRYIKIEATNFGTIPSGNPGAGSKPWLFIDEISVE